MDKATLSPEQLKELLGDMTVRDLLDSDEFRRQFNLELLNLNEAELQILREGKRCKSHPYLTLKRKVDFTLENFKQLYTVALAKQLDCNKISATERYWLKAFGDRLRQRALTDLIKNRLKEKENETDKTDSDNSEA